MRSGETASSTRYFELKTAEGHWSGTLRAERRWSLPGLETCPGCRATWAGILAYLRR
ncbi:double-CXXCG motif protein [Pyxidicoccus xibeiensis]|uniref:double-CXXCG motif protein n=1 Tax=Pyxidicoccus xibeiensis TaxID=2906759 RepID=UPI00389A8E80